jgi:hypothetical protein
VVVEIVSGWRWSAGWAAVLWLIVGAGLATAEVIVAFGVRAMAGVTFVLVATGLLTMFIAVVVGRLADSTPVAVSGAAGLQAGTGLVIGLLTFSMRAFPEFLVVFVPQSLVVCAVAAAAARSFLGLRHDPVWAGIAAGLLGGVVVLLWQLGHSGRAVLVVGAVLVAAAVGLLVRQARHSLVIVPLTVAVAVGVAQAYALVPMAFGELFPPVVAG